MYKGLVGLKVTTGLLRGFRKLMVVCEVDGDLQNRGFVFRVSG